LCDGAYTNIEEFRREEDPILFARGSDPYHYDHSQLLDAYVRLQEVGLLHYRNSLTSAQQYSVAEASTWATDKAESVFTDATPKQVRRRVRNKAKTLRLHPTLVGWYLTKAQLRSGDQVWLAVPPVEYRWGLIGAFHDRLGHSGVNQTLAVMHQHYHWSGMKADISAFVRQCHPCQVRHLELHHVAEVRLPRMSCPFQHVHIDLAGPFPLRQVSAPAGRGPHGRTKTALSTTVVGSAFICLVVDYFTKAAEFLFLPDKTALSVAKVFHDGWLMRYG
jgi:hypothetical protein